MKILSKEQLLIKDNFVSNNSNLLINAVAGSGKTTTILMLLDEVSNSEKCLYLAFNKSVVLNLEDRVKKDNIKINTFHSYGLDVIKKAKAKTKSKTKIRIKKVEEKVMLYKNKLELEMPKDWFKYRDYCDFFNLMRFNLIEDEYGLENVINKYGLTIPQNKYDICFEILQKLNKEPDIDFADMIYRPIKQNLEFEKFDYVFVDEVQDLNICQIKMFERSVAHGGKFVAVGDSKQAIYGFAGADSDSFQIIENLPNTEYLDLTVNFRCGKRIINFVNNINDKIRAFEGNIEGEVVMDGSYLDIRKGDWVLCRNTKPLVVLCLKLIRNKVKANVLGQDFGTTLIKMIESKKTKNKNICRVKLYYDLRILEKKLIKYGIKEPTKAKSYISLLEYVEICEMFLKANTTVDKAILDIKNVFNDNIEQITLSTIHRAKGREAENVFIIHRELIPSKMAVEDWEIEQEKNLEYVAYTRAKKLLTFVTDFDYIEEMEELEKNRSQKNQNNED